MIGYVGAPVEPDYKFEPPETLVYLPRWFIRLVPWFISGGANGADMLADQAAARLGLESLVFSADRWGKAAGPVRNKRMLTHGKPDRVLAYLKRNSKGTRDMIRQAKKAWVPVEVVEI